MGKREEGRMRTSRERRTEGRMNVKEEGRRKKEEYMYICICIVGEEPKKSRYVRGRRGVKRTATLPRQVLSRVISGETKKNRSLDSNMTHVQPSPLKHSFKNWTGPVGSIVLSRVISGEKKTVPPTPT